MILSGRCLEAVFCFLDDEGVLRFQAEPDERCFYGWKRWLMHMTALAGVLCVTIFFPYLLWRKIGKVFRRGVQTFDSHEMDRIALTPRTQPGETTRLHQHLTLLLLNSTAPKLIHHLTPQL